MEEERAPQRDYGVFINPLGLAFGVLGGDIDFRVTTGSAITVGVEYLSHGIVTGYGAHFAPQFFVTDEAFRGVYVMPRVGFSSVSVDYQDIHGSGSAVELGATAGYQWQFADGFAVRLGGGAAYVATSASVDGFDPGTISGLYGRLDGALGYTF